MLSKQLFANYMYVHNCYYR